MQQVLFTIPILNGKSIGPVTFPPDGVPVYGFGAMLFLTFILATWWGSVRARRVGMHHHKFQDMVIWLFVAGIVGARLLYMVQYSDQFPDKSLGGLVSAFFQIWRGGIIFYGSVLGGVVGYGLFYWFVLRKLKVPGWQLADVVAPLLALGLAIGRLGCYLNGCCWGQVACEETCPVPLGGAHFPLLPGHCRDQLVDIGGTSKGMALQTSAGFTSAERLRGATDDPRTFVVAVERGSPADAAGLKPGDRVVKVNGRANQFVVEIVGAQDKVTGLVESLRAGGLKIDDAELADAKENAWRARASFDDLGAFAAKRLDALRDGQSGMTFFPADTLWVLAKDWPRGRAAIDLGVQRGDQTLDLPPFTPRSVGLYPTQLYETTSMLLLILLLLAVHPHRRHDGQTMVLCMVGYAVHRFINESLRIEPTIGGGLTLSQWGSVVILTAAVCIEVYLWRTSPSRWKASEAKP